jgi:NADH dehydrogenase (ubiquinone) 1 alpha subcomplex subunit 9
MSESRFLFDDHVKELKLCSVSGKTAIIRDMEFENKEMIDWTMQNSNVVINLLGARNNVKKRTDFEYINIDVPKRLAEAAAKNPRILRFIHFSSAGANPHSESLDLQTKYFGEQEVLNAFPNATIIRPCNIVGWNDRFVQRFITEREYWHRFNIVYDDCSAKRQPVSNNVY